MQLYERPGNLLCCAEGALGQGTRLGRLSLPPDVFDLCWRWPLGLTGPDGCYSAKLLPRSLSLANGLDQYSLLPRLHSNYGSLIKPRVFPNILGNEYSTTLIYNSLGHTYSH